MALVHVGDADGQPQAAGRRARHRLGRARAQRHEPGDAREGRRRAHARGDDEGQARRAAGPARGRRQPGVHRPRRARRDRDHPRRSPPPAHRVRPAAGRDRSGHDARLLRAAPQGDRGGDRARDARCLQRLPAAITGSWFENRIIPLDAATPDQPGVAMLVDAYNKESEKRRGGRQAGRPRHRAPPRPKPAAGRPGARAAGGPATSAPPRAAAATRPRSRCGRRPSTRARCPRWRASAATRTRRASAATSPATCNRAAPADVARRRARALRQRRVRGLPRPGQQAWRGRRQEGTTGARASPRRSAAAATPPTSPTANSTTRSSSRRSSGPGHGATAPLSAGARRWRRGRRLLYSTRHAMHRPLSRSPSCAGAAAPCWRVRGARAREAAAAAAAAAGRRRAG